MSQDEAKLKENGRNDETSEPVEVQQETKRFGEVDLDRIHIQNIPHFIGFKQFKKQLEKIVDEVKIKKIRQMGDYAYVTFETPDDAQEAIKRVNGSQIKNFKLTAQLAAKEEKCFRPKADHLKDEKPKTARESVTPLADEPYDRQLAIKFQNSEKQSEKLYKQMQQGQVKLPKLAEFKKLLGPVVPSPKIVGYRNKCEFTIGQNLDDEICVGFVGGKFSLNKHYVIPVERVENISSQMIAIVEDVQEFVRSSGMDPFDEFERTGFWRMLTVREFSGDAMLIFTVFPTEDEAKEKEFQEQIVKRFLDPSTLTSKRFRVSSLYWQKLVNCSDPTVYQHIGGTPYIYESILDCRFRVSPAAFFQTNSQGAGVLYSVIGERCGLSDIPSETPPATEIEEPESKKMKTDNESEESPEDFGTIFLDICCGTGTIGQCVLNKYKKNKKIFCIGVEMIANAVEDAKQNAKSNKMENCSRYISGKAEDVFRDLRYLLPNGYDLRKSKVVGVLDPPRAGMHDRVIHACREMSTLRRLVFVSCDPAAATKNLVDLCRPTSRKFMGDPFSISSIQPVDMFPQTAHVEWVVQLDR